jgi:hypothetical protein
MEQQFARDCVMMAFKLIADDAAKLTDVVAWPGHNGVRDFGRRDTVRKLLEASSSLNAAFSDEEWPLVERAFARHEVIPPSREIATCCFRLLTLRSKLRPSKF